jgi:hypothetical protein
MNRSPAANDNFIERTCRPWRSRLGRDVGCEDARQIAENVTGFFAVLAEWSNAERPPPTITRCPPSRMTAEGAMTAESIAKALGGHKAGAAWMARCPAHDDRAPSLSIADGCDGKVLLRRHAGCDQHDVIAALRARVVWDADERRPIRFSRQPDRPLLPKSDGDAGARHLARLAIGRGFAGGDLSPVA